MPAISDLIFITKSINKINILPSHIEEKYWNFKIQNFGMYQTCCFRATISQKSTYLIQHYAISSFGWTYLYLRLQIFGYYCKAIKLHFPDIICLTLNLGMLIRSRKILRTGGANKWQKIGLLVHYLGRLQLLHTFSRQL